jgi:hypothetical protein
MTRLIAMEKMELGIELSDYILNNEHHLIQRE